MTKDDRKEQAKQQVSGGVVLPWNDGAVAQNSARHAAPPLMLTPKERTDFKDLEEKMAALRAQLSNNSEAPTQPAPAATELPDTDALRALIAEVIREELSGALGERVTDNVKKLIRREVTEMLKNGSFG